MRACACREANDTAATVHPAGQPASQTAAAAAQAAVGAGEDGGHLLAAASGGGGSGRAQPAAAVAKEVKRQRRPLGHVSNGANPPSTLGVPLSIR